MFASLAIGSDRDRATVSDDETANFAFPQAHDVEPGAVSALLLESTKISALDEAALIDAMKAFGKLASWAQAKQSAAIAELAKRRPPAWVHDDGIDDYPAVSRYVAEEIACALSLTVRGAENRLDLALRLDEALPQTQQAWERGELDWPRVNVIAERTAALSPEQAGAVESAILPKVADKTTGQTRRIVTEP